MAIEAAAPQFQIFGALAMGIIIGIVELAFVHADEAGMGWLKHGLHAFPVTIILTFIGMNVPYVTGLLGWSWLHGLTGKILVSAAIGIVATIKVKGAAAITQGHGSVGEKFGHALIVGALIAASPWIWPFVEPMLPSFLKF
ncbi:MAG: hypothetical protein ACOCWQ_03730 [Nanoarchaeota archaeon]